MSEANLKIEIGDPATVAGYRCHVEKISMAGGPNEITFTIERHPGRFIVPSTFMRWDARWGLIVHHAFNDRIRYESEPA